MDEYVIKQIAKYAKPSFVWVITNKDLGIIYGIFDSYKNAQQHFISLQEIIDSEETDIIKMPFNA